MACLEMDPYKLSCAVYQLQSKNTEMEESEKQEDNKAIGLFSYSKPTAPITTIINP